MENENNENKILEPIEWLSQEKLRLEDYIFEKETEIYKLKETIIDLKWNLKLITKYKLLSLNTYIIIILFYIAFLK